MISRFLPWIHSNTIISNMVCNTSTEMLENKLLLYILYIKNFITSRKKTLNDLTVEMFLILHMYANVYFLSNLRLFNTNSLSSHFPDVIKCACFVYWMTQKQEPQAKTPVWCLNLEQQMLLELQLVVRRWSIGIAILSCCPTLLLCLIKQRFSKMMFKWIIPFHCANASNWQC